MSFVSPLQTYPAPDIKDLLLKQYKGASWDELPTPSLIVKESVINDNVTKNLNRIKDIGTRFRAHVKTHKCIEGTRRQLGYDLPNYDGPKHDSIVVSTLKEIWEIIAYEDKTGVQFVKDVIFGIPNITKFTLPQIVELSKKVETFTLMIDSLGHIDILEKYSREHQLTSKFSVIIKLDNGTHRAGILNTDYLVEVINKVLSSDNVHLYGFYVHSGHSYNSKTIQESEERLLQELETVERGLNKLAEVAPNVDLSQLVVSVGATPTIHSLEHHLYQKSNDKINKIASSFKAKLELHAGNYPFCDLQQCSTGCVDKSNIAAKVTTTVISQYPEREDPVGELLTNAGVIALTKEVAHQYPGFGIIEAPEEYGSWSVNRLSQEHGILRPVEGSKAKLIPIGTTVKVLPNHSCITVNSFNAFFVLDDDEKVKDVWIPWRGW